MGYYGDKADKMSDWLGVSYGEKKEVEWTGESKESDGQYGEVMIFQFNTEAGVKKFTISNARLVRQFDNYKAGDKLIIHRNLKDQKPAYSIYKPGEEAPF